MTNGVTTGVAPAMLPRPSTANHARNLSGSLAATGNATGTVAVSAGVPPSRCHALGSAKLDRSVMLVIVVFLFAVVKIFDHGAARMSCWAPVDPLEVLPPGNERVSSGPTVGVPSVPIPNLISLAHGIGSSL